MRILKFFAIKAHHIKIFSSYVYFKNGRFQSINTFSNTPEGAQLNIINSKHLVNYILELQYILIDYNDYIYPGNNRAVDINEI